MLKERRFKFVLTGVNMTKMLPPLFVGILLAFAGGLPLRFDLLLPLPVFAQTAGSDLPGQLACLSQTGAAGFAGAAPASIGMSSAGLLANQSLCLPRSAAVSTGHSTLGLIVPVGEPGAPVPGGILPLGYAGWPGNHGALGLTGGVCANHDAHFLRVAAPRFTYQFKPLWDNTIAGACAR
jgi:hypothetical protein